MTLPNYAQIIQGIFPDALEVEEIKDKENFSEGFIVKFDPQKCVLTPAAWDLVQKLNRKIDKISYNPGTNQVEVHIQ